MYFVVTLPIASKTEWSHVASSLNMHVERTNVSQNLRVTERMKGKPHQENLLCLAMLSLLTTDEMILEGYYDAALCISQFQLLTSHPRDFFEKNQGIGQKGRVNPQGLPGRCKQLELTVHSNTIYVLVSL